MIESTPTITLMDHQQKGVLIASEKTHFLFAHEPGCGKTIMLLAACDTKPRRTLIVSPKAIMRAAWESDAKLMGQAITVLHGDPPKRKEIMRRIADGGTGIVVTNYETFRDPVIRQWAIAEAGIERVIFDESSKLKAIDSKTTKAAIDFSDRVQSVYLLSGTPAPNGPHELWSQLRCLDKSPGGVADVPGGVLPPNFWRWANYWLVPTKRFVRGKEVVVAWTIKPSMRDAFTAMLRTCCWRLRKDECFTLPDRRDVVINVDMDQQERRAYSEVLDHLRAEFDGQTLSINAQAQLGKLRQLTGGGMYIGAHTKKTGSAKIDALREIVEAIGPTEPVVIWAEFRFEIDAIAEAMGEMGRSVAILDGRGKDNGGDCARFQSGESDANTLICHPQSVGHGVTLTRAAYAVFYSFSFSYEQHAQARDRIYRKGQTRKTINYYLLARDTIDHVTRKVLFRKESGAEAVLDAVRELVA